MWTEYITDGGNENDFDAFSDYVRTKTDTIDYFFYIFAYEPYIKPLYKYLKTLKPDDILTYYYISFGNMTDDDLEGYLENFYDEDKIRPYIRKKSKELMKDMTLACILYKIYHENGFEREKYILTTINPKINKIFNK